MIRRSPRPTSHFTTIRNDVLRDERLSYRARGVLVSILSRPDNWRISRDRLAREGKEGRDAVNTALNELTEFGYIKRQKTQREDGTFSTELVVYDQPENWESTETEAFSADFQAPTTGKPTTGKPTVGKPVANRNTVTKKREELSPSSNDEDQFNEWWNLYPRKTGKQDARKAWKTATKQTSPADIIAATQHQTTTSGSPLNREPQYVPYPASWLRAGHFLDTPTETQREIRPYDAPKRRGCNNCDQTGYIHHENPDGTSWVTECECNQ